MNPKKTRIKIPHFVAALLIFYLLSVAVHEYAHFLTLIALGGKGYIMLTSCVIVELPPAFSRLVYLSGGLACAALYFILWLIDEDPEHHVILPAIAARQLVYGVGEGLWALTWNPLFAEVGDFGGFLALVAVILFPFISGRFEKYDFPSGTYETSRFGRPVQQGRQRRGGGQRLAGNQAFALQPGRVLPERPEPLCNFHRRSIFLHPDTFD